MTNEYQITQSKDFFTSIPNVVFDMGLNPYSLVLYFFLTKLTFNGSVCFMTTRNLANNLNVSPMTITRAIRDLAENFLIFVEKINHGFGKTKNHIFVNDKIWDLNQIYRRQDQEWKKQFKSLDHESKMKICISFLKGERG